MPFVFKVSALAQEGHFSWHNQWGPLEKRFLVLVKLFPMEAQKKQALKGLSG
jgi:hypothetical protein